MSGRAGRRGLDERGIVILMVDEKMEPSVAKSMVKGSADPLNSSFYISYNMLLNLMRVEGMNPEDLLRKSFHQFQSTRKIPQSQKSTRKNEKKKSCVSSFFSSQIRRIWLEKKDERHDFFFSFFSEFLTIS